MLNLVKKYLDLNFYLNEKEEFEELFLSHPNYPSVYAITDTFDLLGIKNVAVKIPKEELPELPNSFLAFYNNELTLVNKIEREIEVLTSDGEKNLMTKFGFYKGWEGIIIAIETNQIIIEKIKSNSRWVAYCSPLIFLITLSIVYNSYSIDAVIFLVTSIIGFLISVLIVREKLGIKSEAISKFCNIHPNASCDTVIRSKKGILNKWINFTDLPLLFFGISIVTLLVNPIVAAKNIGTLSILSIPFTVYSIWLQKFQLKKWCILCLAVSYILVFQSVIGYIAEKDLFAISTFNDFGYLFSFMAITSIWFGIRPFVESKFRMENEIKELKKFKRNYSVFNFLSKKVNLKVEELDQLEALQFGNPKSSIVLTLFLSPSCNHCNKTFQVAIKLVHKYPEKIFLKVLFNINPKNNDNPYKIIVERLFSINEVFPEKIEEAISDWHIRGFKLENWLEKWNVVEPSEKINEQIQQQYDWCLKNGFNYTPVKIVNNRLYPNEYDINELKYFLNDLSENTLFEEEDYLIQA